MTEEAHQLILGEKEDLKSIIEWQQERYHQIRSLTQGLFAAMLATLAILLTGYAAIGSPIPNLPPNNTVSTHPFIGDIASPIILGFGLLIAIILCIFVIIALAISLWICIDVILARPLPSQEALAHSTILVDLPPGALLEGVNVPTTTQLYQRVQAENREAVSRLRGRFRDAGLRFIVSMILLVAAITLYSRIMSSDHSAVVAFSVALVIPVVPVLLTYLWGPGDAGRELNPRELGLFRELLLDEDHELNRWGDVKIFRVERFTFLFSQILSIFVIIATILSYVY